MSKLTTVLIKLTNEEHELLTHIKKTLNVSWKELLIKLSIKHSESLDSTQSKTLTSEIKNNK